MGLNFLEEIVADYFRVVEEAIVLENVSFLVERQKGAGYSDIDVLAILPDKIIMAECQSHWLPSKSEEEEALERLERKFDLDAFLNSNKTIKELFPEKIKEHKIEKWFIVFRDTKKETDKWLELKEKCSKREIQLVEAESIIYRLIHRLREYVEEKHRLGSYKGITRVLLQLVIQAKHNKHNIDEIIKV